MEYEKWPEFAKKRFGITQIFFAGHVPADSQTTGTDKSKPKVCAEKMLEWFYATLTTLDAKSSALMRLNGVLIAAAAFLIGLFGRETILSHTHLEAILILSSAFLSAISIACCLVVVDVSWDFLEKVIEKPDGTFDCSAEMRDLATACIRRQKAYRTAWLISAIAVTGFLLELGWQTIYVVACG